jgi:hypothetical protein
MESNRTAASAEEPSPGSMESIPACAEEELCPICFLEMENPGGGLWCRHTFCEACLYQWIKTKHSASQLATCPICRTILTETDTTDYELDQMAELWELDTTDYELDQMAELWELFLELL